MLFFQLVGKFVVSALVLPSLASLISILFEQLDSRLLFSLQLVLEAEDVFLQYQDVVYEFFLLASG